MEDMIFKILKENNIIGKGSFGKIYYNKNSYPNYIVKKMKKYNTYENNFILNNIKELWWYSLISKNDINLSVLNKNNQKKEQIIDNINDLSNINLTNIPKLLDYHIDSDYIYLLLDYKGISINNLIKNNTEFDINLYIKNLKLIPLIIYSCSKVFIQLHYANIRHGDVSISNIMFNEKENNELKQISIIDWGSVTFLKSIINIYSQCAPEFNAPEFNDEICSCDIKIPSIKSDIFSLGLVILYILDPSKSFVLQIEKYIKDSIMIDELYNILDDIINKIIKKYKEIDIEKYIDKRVFFLLKKMLDVNQNTRIDIDSLYMDELFSNYRKQESDFDKYYLKTILRKRDIVVTDEYKNLLVEQTHNYLKSYKSRIIKNYSNSKYFKLIDTRIILTPSLQLFYTYLQEMNIYKNNIHISCLDNLKCLKTIENKLNKDNSNSNNINHYIISFICCIKWIDILFNDDISIFQLYDYYTYLYTLFSKMFTESIILDLVNFSTYFDLTFFNIFKKLQGIIFTYPYFMDFKYDYINHSDVKKMLISTDKF
jgi:hypothetical protein